MKFQWMILYCNASYFKEWYFNEWYFNEYFNEYFDEWYSNEWRTRNEWNNDLGLVSFLIIELIIRILSFIHSQRQEDGVYDSNERQQTGPTTQLL